MGWTPELGDELFRAIIVVSIFGGLLGVALWGLIDAWRAERRRGRPCWRRGGGWVA
jgi:hypothetical protein